MAQTRVSALVFVFARPHLSKMKFQTIPSKKTVELPFSVIMDFRDEKWTISDIGAIGCLYRSWSLRGAETEMPVCVCTREQLVCDRAAQNGLSSLRSISFDVFSFSCFPNVATVPHPQLLFKKKTTNKVTDVGTSVLPPPSYTRRLKGKVTKDALSSA